MSQNEPILFETTDPMSRQIRLTTRNWEEHIQPKHAETDDIYIKKNVHSPQYIVKNMKPDKENPGQYIIDETRQDYIGTYKYVTAEGEANLKVIKTIVQLEDDNKGFVVTNYILRNLREIKLGGGVIYDRTEELDI